MFYNEYKPRCHWKESKVYRKNPVYNHHYEFRYMNQRYPLRYLSWRNFNKVFTRRKIKMNIGVVINQEDFMEEEKHLLVLTKL